MVTAGWRMRQSYNILFCNINRQTVVIVLQTCQIFTMRVGV